MCFGGSSPKVSVPAPPPGPPAPATPPPPAQPAPAPKSLQDSKAEQGVRPKTSARQRMAIQRGTSQLRIPLNVGNSGGGGLNV